MECNREILEKLIFKEKRSYTYIGKLFNISSNAVKKRAKKLGLILPRRRVINSKENFSHKGYKRNSLVFSISEKEFINIINSYNNWVDIGEKLGYKSNLSPNVKAAIETRCKELGIKLNILLTNNNDVLTKTKGELFNSRKNWQSARSAIQKSARRVYFENIDKPKCAICGYNKHVEVAHKKSVSEFDDNTLIKDINSINNLVGLCPNHHWEFDNGLLTLENF